MFRKFPEITDFFKKNRFSHEDFSSLVKQLEERYLFFEEKKSIYTHISLELIKFQLESQAFDNIPDPIDKNKNIMYLINKVKGKINYWELGKSMERHLESFSDLTIQEISKIIGLKPLLFSDFMLRNGIKNMKYNDLSAFEKDNVRNYFLRYMKVSKNLVEKHRIKSFKLEKKKPIELSFDNHDNPIDSVYENVLELFKRSNENVYDKLLKYGGHGKLIYIRMRT